MRSIKNDRPRLFASQDSDGALQAAPPSLSTTTHVSHREKKFWTEHATTQRMQEGPLFGGVKKFTFMLRCVPVLLPGRLGLAEVLRRGIHRGLEPARMIAEALALMVAAARTRSSPLAK
jgi:hypothetical protein